MSALAPAAVAQYRASIQGTVADTQGGVIPGAKLTLTNMATNETQVRTSNDVGVYNFNALPPGRFKLVAEKEGFQTKTLDNVQIIPEQANAVNVQLEVGAAATTVTVDASGRRLLTRRLQRLAGPFPRDQIQHMPSFGRDVFQLTTARPRNYRRCVAGREEARSAFPVHRDRGYRVPTAESSRLKMARRPWPTAGNMKATEFRLTGSAPQARCGAEPQ